MSDATSHATLETAAGSTPGASDVERLARFSGPPDAFLLELMGAQCRLAGASAGAVLRRGEDGLVCLASVPAAAAPAGAVAGMDAGAADRAHAQAQAQAEAPGWLREASRRLLGGGQPPAEPETFPLQEGDGLYDPAARRHAIVIPLREFASLDGYELFHLDDASPEEAAAACRRLVFTLSMLTLYEARQALAARESELRGLSVATATLAALNRQGRFGSAGLAFCNEVASRFDAERVSVGVVRGRYVKLRSMSQTEHVHRKMAVVQAIEAAMEECLDQDVEVQHPAPRTSRWWLGPRRSWPGGRSATR